MYGGLQAVLDAHLFLISEMLTVVFALSFVVAVESSTAHRLILLLVIVLVVRVSVVRVNVP